MSRDTPLTVYLNEDTKTSLEREADAEDMTLSAYAGEALRDHLKRKATDELDRQINAEKRIEAAATEAVDQITQVTDDLRQMNAKVGAYSVANFELLKSDYKDSTRRDALSTGARRLREDLDTTVEQLDRAAADEAPDASDGNSSLVDDLRGEDDG